MSGIEVAYLIGIVAAFTAFSVTLAWATHTTNKP
mgnify:CR=1 FL=1|jgi:hypothetical protein